MRYQNHEFFYCHDKYSDSNLHYDFSNDAYISKEGRFDFLSHYANFLEDYYNLPKNPKKVFSEEEAKEEMLSLCASEPLPKITKRIVFEKMEASLKPIAKTQNWYLYTDKTVIENGEIVFRANPNPPPPAALFEFEASQSVKEFTFSVYIDSNYKSFVSQVIDSTTARTIELRNGIFDILKLHFYPHGKFYACLGNENEYILDNREVCDYEYDTWQTVKVRLNQNDFTVTLNSNTATFPYTNNLKPDTLFVGSGMHHIGEWKFKPVSFVFENGSEMTDFFESANQDVCECQEKLGEVKLPFRVGGYKNRNKFLVLESDFDAVKSKKAILNVSSLDPHGDVYINGVEVLKTSGFEAQSLDIAKYLSEGKNHIKIVVYPRAGETLFNWHRQTDTYNGWFCEDVSLTFINEAEISDIVVTTDNIDGENIDITVNANISGAKSAKIVLQKIFPNLEQETDLGIFNVDNGVLNASMTVKAKAWTPNSPTLYSVRVIAINENGKEIDDEVIETGFRTISQQDGKIVLNGKPIVLTGALLMQFLPPHDDTPTTHICPRDEQIWQQEKLVRLMGGNTLRLHMLGYGSNDKRYARYADRLGLMLVWITRFIDSAEQMAFSGKWPSLDGYIRQISARRNHPSIIIWEGSNEYHPDLNDINNIYKTFVPAVKSVDKTRLICPISHLYYAADLYPYPNCAYYDDAGLHDHDGNEVKAPDEWTDPLVVRSSHTYILLLGYGTGWECLREQNWSIQPDMFNSKKHAYLITEFAVIGRPNPNIPEADEFFNDNSYEVGDETALGFNFTREQWRESQAYQALAARVDTQTLFKHGADGMLWCCLMSGANNGSYLKPPLDCYGYPKYAFYTLRDGYSQTQVISDTVDVLRTREFSFKPILIGLEDGKNYNVEIAFSNENGDILEKLVFNNITASSKLDKITLKTPENGYYSLKYSLEEI